MQISLTKEQHHVLYVVLNQFKYMIAPGHPEWHDLSERTHLDADGTLAVLAEIKEKLLP